MATITITEPLYYTAYLGSPPQRCSEVHLKTSSSNSKVKIYGGTRTKSIELYGPEIEIDSSYGEPYGEGDPIEFEIIIYNPNDFTVIVAADIGFVSTQSDYREYDSIYDEIPAKSSYSYVTSTPYPVERHKSILVEAELRDATYGSNVYETSSMLDDSQVYYETTTTTTTTV